MSFVSRLRTSRFKIGSTTIKAKDDLTSDSTVLIPLQGVGSGLPSIIRASGVYSTDSSNVHNIVLLAAGTQVTLTSTVPPGHIYTFVDASFTAKTQPIIIGSVTLNANGAAVSYLKTVDGWTVIGGFLP